MTFASGDQHVYLRTIDQGERTSLSVLASFVAPGARVLDLGTGSGALGQYLSDHANCQVDGLTINEQEAALARPHYRRVVVADLDAAGWPSLFAPELYDFVICADVLEHLRQPEKILAVLPQLLAPGGRLLISVPNAAYAGLVAELMQGDFTYREEGLLDRTHLRFFTRRSLDQLLASTGWSTDQVETITRPLTESEFRISFDRLPPAVSRYLQSQPDAGTYQFVVAARNTGASVADAPMPAAAGPAIATFSAQLYLGTESGFDEKRKLLATGTMGVDRQVLRFAIPRSERVSCLRFDPADRPGFLHLYRLTLTAAGSVVWQWRCDVDGLDLLEKCPSKDVVMRSPWPASAALLLLHGDDPSIQLPIPAQALAAGHEGAEMYLEAELGWPMSADYMALAEVVVPLRQQIEMQDAHARQEARRWQQEMALVASAAHQEKIRLQRELDTANEETLAQKKKADQLLARKLALESSVLLLEQQHTAIVEEKSLVVRQKSRVETDLALLGRQYGALADHLRWIESSTVFRATRPLVHAKMKLERLLGRRPHEVSVAPTAAPVEPQATTVDVIVPVYRGLEDTRRSIESVLASQCRTPWRLVVINDASPEPEVTQWLRDAALRDNRILLLENQENLGFVGTVNRGMALSESHDALLLNSDTEVANDWLDRLRKAAYCDAKVASVTPFSNNATICSYPRFCEPNELPPGHDTASLDRIFAKANAGGVIDVPTGVGFCMYIRRDCLVEVGLFDVEQFGKGYGEENDFCRRAAAAGWRNLHALDTFVLHTGGVSFGASKSQRERDAVEKLRRLHPSYDGLVHDFVVADPAATARLAADLGRVEAAALPCILAVLHNREGGTLRHAAELADHLRDRAVFFSLTPAPGSAVWLELLEPGSGFRLEFNLPAQWDALLDALRSMGIVHVHYHHVLGHRDEVLGLGEALGVTWDFTAHDYYAMCPQISLTDENDRFCGEDGSGRCSRCPNAAGHQDLNAWRQRHGRLLTQARHVLAPSQDTADRFARMWPSAPVRLVPHTDIDAGRLPPVHVSPMASGARLRVAVVGALSRIKGADLLEEVALLTARRQAPLEFHLLGYAYRALRHQPNAALTVHGAYEDKDLADLLAWLKPDVVWFPALWPETYSYTLSACLGQGLPVVAPDIGAFAGRLAGRDWSWVQPWDTTPEQWLKFFVQIRQENFAVACSPPAAPTVLENPGALIAAWSYETDYLQGLTEHAVSPLDQAVLAMHRTGHGANRAPLMTGTGAKQAALTSLARLRSHRGLRLVARAIPQHWQTRVKSWLVS